MKDITDAIYENYVVQIGGVTLVPRSETIDGERVETYFLHKKGTCVEVPKNLAPFAAEILAKKHFIPENQQRYEKSIFEDFVDLNSLPAEEEICPYSNDSEHLQYLINGIHRHL